MKKTILWIITFVLIIPFISSVTYANENIFENEINQKIEEVSVYLNDFVKILVISPNGVGSEKSQYIEELNDYKSELEDFKYDAEAYQDNIIEDLIVDIEDIVDVLNSDDPQAEFDSIQQEKEAELEEKLYDELMPEYDDIDNKIRSFIGKEVSENELISIAESIIILENNLENIIRYINEGNMYYQPAITCLTNVNDILKMNFAQLEGVEEIDNDDVGEIIDDSDNEMSELDDPTYAINYFESNFPTLVEDNINEIKDDLYNIDKNEVDLEYFENLKEEINSSQLDGHIAYVDSQLNTALQSNAANYRQRVELSSYKERIDQAKEDLENLREMVDIVLNGGELDLSLLLKKYEVNDVDMDPIRDKFVEVGYNTSQLIQAAGNVVGVLLLMLFGIQYMLANNKKKAELKVQGANLIIGLIIFFGGWNIFFFVYKLASTLAGD